MDNMISIYEDDQAKILVSNSLVEHKDLIVSKLVERLEAYKSIFGVSELIKLTYIMFDDLETYRTYNEKEFNHKCPEYSRGCFMPKDRLSILVITPEVKTNKIKFNKMISSNAHEAFHFYYKEYIYKESQNRVVWFDEGLAQHFSNEYITLTDEELKKLYFDWKKDYIPIDNLNERIQGTSDVPDNLIFKREGVFNGYNTSYLIIRYLSETKGDNYLIELMKDNNKILELGNSNIIEEMSNYYSNKFGTKVL